MRRFQFRPQPALDFRLHREEAAEQALSLAHAEVYIAADSLARAEAGIDTAHAEQTTAWSSGQAVPFEWHRNWIVGLERSVAHARAVLEERQIELRRAAELAREARKQVKVLERLKARAYGAWQLDTRRAEQKALDELAGLKFASRMRAGQENSDERNQSDRQCR
jgi:flagellar export protein FliJ